MPSRTAFALFVQKPLRLLICWGCRRLTPHLGQEHTDIWGYRLSLRLLQKRLLAGCDGPVWRRVAGVDQREPREQCSRGFAALRPQALCWTILHRAYVEITDSRLRGNDERVVRRLGRQT